MRAEPISDRGIGKVRMPAEPGGRSLHATLDRRPHAPWRGEMIHHNKAAAGSQHPPGFLERALRMGNDAHYIGRKRDVERGVWKLEGGRVHDEEPLDLREPLALDARP